MTNTEGGTKQALTFLSDEFNQGDESDIRRGNHGMIQQDPTEPETVLVAEDNRTSCAQTHPVGRC